MIETRVRIVSAANGKAWVLPAEDAGCGGCHARNACGLGGLGRYFGAGRHPVAVACSGSAKAGEELVVAVEEAELFKASLAAYALPVVLGVSGAGLAAGQGAGDGLAVLGMLAGCAAGLLVARFIGRTPFMRARLSNDPPLSGDTP